MFFNIIIAVISILLENLFNIYLSSFRIMTPLFTLLSLIFIFPYFKNSKKEFLIFSFFLGLIYDLLFTNFYILNSILFLIISFFIFYILKTHNYNYFIIIYNSLFVIFFYNVLLFLIFNFFNYINYTIFDLSYILRNFLIGNLSYVTILYFILKRNYFKHIIKR